MSRKALALFSGGLDSVLSVLWMKRLGYEVTPIFFRSYFFSENKAALMSERLDLNLEIIDISEDLLQVLKSPRYGFGKHNNPCIDCHSLMFRTAGRLMEEKNADFLISGEVLGQRPMSQRLDALNAVKKHSGYKDYIIRPLSQKLLPDTMPIREGWVSKDDMLDIQGRSRKRQMELAEEFGIEEYPTPGGGCLLTERIYSLRLNDLLSHNWLSGKYIKYLNIGRHFRLSPDMKLIVGRNKEDNNALEELIEDDVVLRIKNIQGPWGVLNVYFRENGEKTIHDEELLLAASILLTFSGKSAAKDEVRVIYPGGNDKVINAEKLDREKLHQYWITE